MVGGLELEKLWLSSFALIFTNRQWITLERSSLEQYSNSFDWLWLNRKVKYSLSKLKNIILES